MPSPKPVTGTQQPSSRGTEMAYKTLKLAGWTVGISGALLPPRSPKQKTPHAHKRKTRKGRKNRKSRKSGKSRKSRKSRK